METITYGPSESRVQRVTRAAADLPQSTSGAIFTVTSGKRILVLNLYGIVTTNIQAQANATRLLIPGMYLCTSGDINGNAAATMYTLTGTLTDALVITALGAAKAQVAPFIVSNNILLECAASSTGQTSWIMDYILIDADAVVAAA